MTKALQKKQTKKMTKAKVMELTKSVLSIGNLKIKQVMIADIGDGAFTDSSIKVKPHKSGEGIVLKCTDLDRLKKGLVEAGFNPTFTKIIKGNKHFIAFVGHVVIQSNLLDQQNHQALAQPKLKLLPELKEDEGIIIDVTSEEVPF